MSYWKVNRETSKRDKMSKHCNRENEEHNLNLNIRVLSRLVTVPLLPLVFILSIRDSVIETGYLFRPFNPRGTFSFLLTHDTSGFRTGPITLS